MERLASVEMAEGIEKPKMGPVTTGLGEVFHYVVSSERGDDLTRLRTLQDWVIRPTLRTVPGTAEINSWGGKQKQYEVRIAPDRLLKHDISFDQVTAALRANNLNVGGGNIDRQGEMLLVQGIGRTVSVDQIQNIIITARHGVPIHIRDVAEVAIGNVIRRGAVTADGKGEVVLGLGFMIMGEKAMK